MTFRPFFKNLKDNRFDSTRNTIPGYILSQMYDRLASSQLLARGGDLEIRRTSDSPAKAFFQKKSSLKTRFVAYFHF